MTQTPTDALRLVPCPMCGKTDSIENPAQMSGLSVCNFASPAGGWAYQVECVCGVTGPSARTVLQAETKWNRRAAPASPLPGGGDWTDGTPEAPVGSPTWCGWASYEIRRLRSELTAAPTGDAT